MNKSLLKITICILLTTIISSCVTILSPDKQNVKLVTNDSLTKIYLFDSLIANSSEATVTLPKDRNVKQLKIELEGHKSNNYVIAPVNTSPIYHRNFLFFFLIFPLFEPSYSYKIKTYDEVYTFEDKFYKNPIWNKSQKRIYVNNVLIELEKDSNTQIYYNIIDYRDGNEAHRIFELDTIGLTITNFNEYINEKILKKGDFIDTSNIDIKGKSNTLYIDGKINKRINYNISTFNSILGKDLNDFWVTELGVTWYVKDNLGEILYEKNVNCKSGEFVIPLENSEKTIEIIFEDAIHNSFLELFSDENFEDLSKIK